MKKKNNIIYIIISVIVVIAIIVGVLFLLKSNNKLTVEERSWIDNNINTVQNINVVNDALVFGKDGSGVFYDFLNAFSEEYGMQINPITYNGAEVPAGISLGIKNDVTDADTVFYKDHFVLIGKENIVINNLDSLNGKNIGILASDYTKITTYIKQSINYLQYETIDDVYTSLTTDAEYILVPLNQYMDKYLANEYPIVYHFSNINKYYVLQTTGDILSSVLNKYYEEWESEFDNSYNNSEFNLFTKTLNISDADIDHAQSVIYKYGFVNTSPYEIIIGGKYGGIVAVYLHHFSNFSNIEFSFNKYSNFNKFTKALKSGKIDVYFNYYNLNNEYLSTDGPAINYTVVARRDNDKVINSIYSLINEEVYVLENSKLASYLQSFGNMNVKTYANTKELLKLNKKDVYIVLDENVFNYYSTNKLDNYTKRYSNTSGSKYDFRIKDNAVIAKLMSKYFNTLDDKEIINLGLENHYETVKSGSLISTIAKYILYLFIVIVAIVLYIIKKSKKITIARKIKKDDKMKFIDQLTSLKNRNYLNENIEVWNNNTIYPQTIIVFDLNRVQEINDTKGYDEGDKQIKAAANALIKTQLDNSEVMRTDGNEFVIYLVGYSQKQVTNYLHKLNKEMSKLPYKYGAEYGYSMINDNIKTIEDAMTEASQDVKKQKENDSEREAKK